MRPAADALYPSALEPWSEYLTGEQGKAPDPFYDPLAMWIDEVAQARHRAARLVQSLSRAPHVGEVADRAATTSPTPTRQSSRAMAAICGWTRAKPRAAQRTLDVILDVVRRYDIDGVHIDDYFYPYPVNVDRAACRAAEQESISRRPFLAALPAGGGTLDARRLAAAATSIALIERIYTSIHREKPWVRFGISPFGLGRPDRRPPGIAGFSQYDKLYADVELWLNQGLARLSRAAALLAHRPARAGLRRCSITGSRKTRSSRHVWPGLFTSRIDNSDKSWPAAEIVNQVALTRTKKMQQGHIHFSMVALLENRQGHQRSTQSRRIPGSGTDSCRRMAA